MIPISLDALKAAIQFMPLDLELKQSLIKNSEILIEFRSYLSQKYNVSSSKAETMIKEHMQSNFDNKSIDEVSKIAHQYAEKEGFQKSSELESAVTELINLQKRLTGAN